MRVDWKLWVGLVVSGLLLWWLFADHDIGAIASGVAAADPWMLIACGALVTGGGVIRAVRWKLLLEPLGIATTLNDRWAALNIGFMVTNLLAGRLGEIVRPFALSRLTPVSMSGALGTVVLERVLDMVALLLLLIVTLLSPAFPADATVMGRHVAYAATATVAAASILVTTIIVLVIWPGPLIRAVTWVARIAPGDLERAITARLHAFLTGLDLIRRPASLVRALLWSLVLWVWMASSFWFAFRAFDLELGATAAMFTQVAVSIFVALPAAPGFLGTLQAGVNASVHNVFGVPAEPTLSLSLGYHAAGWIPVTLIGLYYAGKMGLRLGSIGSVAEEALESESDEA